MLADFKTAYDKLLQEKEKSALEALKLQEKASVLRQSICTKDKTISDLQKEASKMRENISLQDITISDLKEERMILAFRKR